MGIRNAQAALAVDVDKLSAEARLTLLAMAMLSFDDTRNGKEARLYYAGWRTAMIRQGYWPDERAKRRFIRHIAELRERGIVETATSAAHGRNAVYRLRLPVENSALSVDNSAEAEES